MEENVKVRFRLVRKSSIAPKRATTGSAGFDLFADIDKPFNLHAAAIQLFETGVTIELPFGYEGQIRTRSGMATNQVVVLNSPGTIDSDYRGEIKVLLRNFSPATKRIQPGDRIAQLVITKLPLVELESVGQTLSLTDRGGGGFGSTGR